MYRTSRYGGTPDPPLLPTAQGRPYRRLLAVTSQTPPWLPIRRCTAWSSAAQPRAQTRPAGSCAIIFE